MVYLGLDDFFKNYKKDYKGASFSWRLKMLFLEIRYAFQRAWRGYDDFEIFDMKAAFLYRMRKALPVFKEDNIADWWNDKVQYEKDISECIHTKEETDAIIQEMIDAFKNSDEDVWIDMGLDPCNKEDSKEIRKIEEEAHESQKKALDMFVKYFDQLWI